MNDQPQLDPRALNAILARASAGLATPEEASADEQVIELRGLDCGALDDLELMQEVGCEQA